MSRYIDVSNLDIPSDENDYDELVAFADKIAEMIVDAPSIEIVRCKECKHWCCHDDVDYDQTEFVFYCETNEITFKGDDFCSYGEREDE